MSPLPQVPAVTRTDRVWTAPWTQSKDQLNPAMWHGIGTHAIGLDGAMWRKRPLDCTVPGRAAMKRRWSQAVSGAPSTRTEPGGAGPGSGTLVGAPNVALGPPQNPGGGSSRCRRGTGNADISVTALVRMRAEVWRG